MNWSLTFTPFIPLWALVALGLVGVALIAPLLLRRVRGAWIRLAALGALLAALAGPVLLQEQRDPLPTVVAMVVDRTASQTLSDREQATAAMRANLAQRFGELKNIDLRTIEVGGKGDGAPVDGTELFKALATGLADVAPERIGAVVMLTDGQVHDVPTTAPTELLGGAPLHALISGKDNERDRQIVIRSAPRFAIVGEKQVIEYSVVDQGIDPSGPVRVSITRDGEPLATENVQPGAVNRFEIDVAHAGQNIFEFEAAAVDGELTTVNNRAAAIVDGIRENLRVLLVSGEPHAGERIWRNLLKSDASVDLVHFTILRPPEKQDGTPINELSLIAFPTRELFSVKIDQFDLIIFDRYAQRGVLPILYFDNIARYVRNGGALLVASGPDYASEGSLYQTPLADVLPAAPTGRVIEKPFSPEITDLGKRHPVTRGLEGGDTTPPHWSRWFRQVETDTPTGEVIMKGADEDPLLVLQREGKGRVALLLSDQVWLWARGYEGGGPHVDLLRRLAHWLMKEPELEEEALRASARGATLTIDRQTMQDTVGPVTVTAPSGASRTVMLAADGPGRFRASFDVDEIGLWRVEDGDRRAFAHVGPANPREFTDVRSTFDKLAPVVQASGGEIARMASASGQLQPPRIVPTRQGRSMGGRDWIGIRMTEASVLKGVDRLPLFSGFLGLAILLGLATATWYREGR
ncbi:hypothetical protein OSH11_10900 [Kaistia dalseonensis]|uniref:Glutamine amidotransferase domain-containing protein n=1 Tax=Kaistia dalseonensis TaxID=410840 RepID=A0ABU0H7P3_9HYPH|nr:hypothetical protein [Kaistia dalseonensis]MCX5495215.1 hypothetical protein [Kaistia dalseonensis]MDQ0437800.1 hypothetical protein [Kaistia dalseonensis]